MSARPVQYFGDAYLERCRQMTPDQICQFLEDFRLMVADLERLEREREAAGAAWAGPTPSAER